MRWNRFRFENFLTEELETTFTLDTNNTDIPVVVSGEIKILPVQTTPNPDYNPKIEMLHGPLWQFTNSVAISSYEVQPINIDAVKNMMKEQVAAERYRRSTLAVDVTIEGTSYKFNTDKETKSAIHSALTSSTNSLNWKIDADTWVVLTNTELQLILNTIVAHVQTCFDWEQTKQLEIDGCTTHQALDVVEITVLNQDRVI
jgi:hypothetical protein